MTTQRLLWLVLVSAVLLFTPSPAGAHTLEEEHPTHPSEVLDEMFFYAQTRNYQAVVRLLQSISSITQHMKREYGIDSVEEIRRAVPDGYEAVIKAIQRFVYTDMAHHYNLSLNKIDADREAAQTDLRKAYRNYLLLSPYVQTDHFLIDQKIKNRFRRMVTATTDSKALVPLINEMGTLLLKALPDLK